MMDHEQAHDDLERIDSTTPVGWLIMTGAAAMVGVTPWTAYLGMHRLVNLRPGNDPTEQMLEDWALPLLIGAFAAAIGATVAVMAARAGRPLPGSALAAMGAVMGTVIAWLRMQEIDVGILFGTACGLIGGAAAAFVRARHLR